MKEIYGESDESGSWYFVWSDYDGAVLEGPYKTKKNCVDAGYEWLQDGHEEYVVDIIKLYEELRIK